MEYVEWRVRIPPEAIEAVGNLLCEEGAGGLWVEDEEAGRLRAYFPADDAEERLTRLGRAFDRLAASFPRMRSWTGERRTVADAEWEEAWKAFYHPFRVGRRLLIRPSWEEVEPRPGEIVLTLDPGMAFGTGTHATTQLCLEAIERWYEEGLEGEFLDVGTGSGILSVAAVRLGAAGALALDTDPVAVRTARANALRNGVADRVEVRLGSADGAPGNRFAAAAANIDSATLPALLPHLRRALRPGGRLVLSGFLVDGAERLEAALAAASFSPCGRAEREGWVALRAVRDESAPPARGGGKDG